MLRVFRPWLLPFAAAAVVVVVGAVQTSRRPPTSLFHGVEVSGPTFYGARLEFKERVVEEMVAGRLTLLEAASALKALDAEGAPYPLEAITDFVPGASLDEGYCRKVISSVRNAAPPDQADYLACCLGAELETRLRDGTLLLTDSGSAPAPPASTP